MFTTKSTDRDLLVAQELMGRLRHPTMTNQELVALVDKSQQKLDKRFIKVDQGKSQDVTPRHKMHKNYTMTIGFSNSVQAGSVRYRMEATFQMKNVPGVAEKAPLCAEAAKEEFRKRLGLLLRDHTSELYHKFFDRVKVSVEDGPKGKDTGREEKALEAFRKWIGNSLRDKESKIHKNFFRRVSYKETYEMKTCKKCHKEVPKYMVADAATVAAYPELTVGVCFSCAPPPEVADDGSYGLSDDDDLFEDDAE